MFAEVLAVLMGKKENFMQTFRCLTVNKPGLDTESRSKPVPRSQPSHQAHVQVNEATSECVGSYKPSSSPNCQGQIQVTELKSSLAPPESLVSVHLAAGLTDITGGCERCNKAHDHT